MIFQALLLKFYKARNLRTNIRIYPNNITSRWSF
jgi:hypothetical protein